MSAELSDLYQQVILDHNKRPRNRGKLPTANRSAHGDNPTCGDQCSVYLRLDGDRIAHEPGMLTRNADAFVTLLAAVVTRSGYAWQPSLLPPMRQAGEAARD